jgi:feruloyl esterase
MGHQSTDGDAIWAYNNPQAEIDHGYRAGHVAALAGKAIVERYYGQNPRKSYFIGCSTGGRQAMMEAQRFPWDFDGIVAGAPSLSLTGVHMNLLWANRALIGETGEPVLKRADIDLLHKAVVAKCDLNDGIKDGLIGDPRACAFDPAVLRCTTARTSDCLSAKQIEAVKRIYSGPVTSKGEPIYVGGAFVGSEQTWLDWFKGGPASRPGGIYNFVREEFRYSAFDPNAGPGWKPEDFDFDRDYKRLGVAEGLSSAVNPDLRRFKAAGGKLLAYMGWTDITGMSAVADYYETAEKTSGGRAATQSFFRLFAIPGMDHCTGGEGAFAVDYLGYLETWVEKGQPPEKLISAHVEIHDLRPDNPDYSQELMRRSEFPLDPATIEFSRPVYPYPTIAKYLGRGDPGNAASFGPVEPPARSPRALD